MRERLGCNPAEEVVHDRIAHHHDIDDFRCEPSRREKQLLNQRANLPADQILEAGAVHPRAPAKCSRLITSAP